MRIAMRAIAIAAVVAVPAFATPANANPAVCFGWTSQQVYTGPAGTVTVPLPSGASVQPSCTVTTIREVLGL